MKYTFSTFLMATSILLSSCDPGVSYKRVVKNDSDYDLKISLYVDSNSHCVFIVKKDSTITIAKHGQSIIGSYSGLGQKTRFKDCQTCFDSIKTKVEGHDSLSININLNDASNWKYNIIDNSFKDGGACECTLIISNENIK